MQLPPGSGHALTQAYDCSDNPMARAVIGLAPQPRVSGYLDATYKLVPNAKETSANGLFAGLGFT